jgi:methyl-accepting chemotaxis protein
MSAPKRRRWIDVIRRTAGAAASSVPTAGLDDADLWTSRDEAAKASGDGFRASERLETTAARERVRAEVAAERAAALAARAEGIAVVTRRVEEVFERLRMVALNAGLEGSRAQEGAGRALLLVGDEIRAHVDRGAEAARELVKAVDEVATDAIGLRDRVQEVRSDAADIATDAATTKASAQEVSRALDRLERQLRKATGFDPEVARAVSMAADHARGLLAALSTIQTSHVGSMALGALRPVLRPVARALGDLAVGGEEPEPEEERG